MTRQRAGSTASRGDAGPLVPRRAEGAFVIRLGLEAGAQEGCRPVALEALGADASEAVMVGDSLMADIAGARSLGMGTVWRRKPGAAAQALLPDWTIDTHTEILGLPLLAKPQ